MITLIKVCTRQAQPEDIKYNPSAAIVIGALYLLINAASFKGISTFSNPFAYATAMTLAQFLALYFFLRLVGKTQRFVQTHTALFGSLIVLGVATIALSLIPILGVFFLFLVIWQFYIPTIVLRSAMEVQTLIAFCTYIGLMFFGFVAVTLVFSNFGPESKEYLELLEQTLAAASSQS